MAYFMPGIDGNGGGDAADGKYQMPLPAYGMSAVQVEFITWLVPSVRFFLLA